MIPPPPPRPSPWLAAGLAAVLWLAATLPAAGDTTVRASLEPSVIGLGETAVFTVEVKGTGFGSVSFRPQFELEVLLVEPHRHDFGGVSPQADKDGVWGRDRRRRGKAGFDDGKDLVQVLFLVAAFRC